MSDFKIYDSCETLTMARFIKCLLQNDLQQLLIEGQATNEELEPFFAIIKTQYVSLLENKESKYIVKLMWQIWNSKTKHWEINTLLKGLQLALDSGLLGNEDIAVLVKEIRSYGYRENLNINNKEQFQASIKLIESKSKRLLTEVASSEVELKRMQDLVGAKELEKSDFVNQNIAVSKFMGYQINFDTTTVEYFCTMIKERNKHLEVKNATDNNLLQKR